jgi:hypothetical protein
MGAASVSMRPPRAATLARSALSPAQNARGLIPLTRERRASFSLALDCRQGGTSLAAFGRRLDRHINLADPATQIIDHMGGNLDPRRKGPYSKNHHPG